MRNRNIVRTLLFLVFFSIGATAFTVSMLSEDLVEYYQNKRALAVASESLERLRSLVDDYDALLARLEGDPNLLRNLAPAALGVEPADADAVYPVASAEELEAVKEILAAVPNEGSAKPLTPAWLTRISRQPQRALLLLSGAFLILISFVWFGTPGPKAGNR